MQVDNTRPFKATRSTTRAELALIIVIIVSFSWSLFALYTLASGSTDISLFGYNIAKSSSSKEQPESAKQNQSRDKHGNNSQVQSSDLSPNEQLAIYKSEILKELLARQREILGTGNQHLQQGPNTLDPNRSPESLLPPDDLLTQFRQKQRLARGQQIAPVHQLNVVELDHRQDGSKSPKNPDNLFKNNLHPPQDQQLQPYIQAASDESSQLQRPFENATLKQMGGSLRLLEDAPSLGQLSSEANRLGQFRTQSRFEDEQKKSIRTLNKFTRPDRQPEKPPPVYLDSDSSSDYDNDDQDSVKPTTTTTAEPEFEPEAQPAITTTVEPLLNESDSADDAEGGAEGGDSDSGDGGNNSGYQSRDDNDADDDYRERQKQQRQDKLDADSMDRARKTVTVIDEEVDRMTQPSIGSISRHTDKQQGVFDDYKNTVQFDDQDTSYLESSELSRKVNARKAGPKNHLNGLVASSRGNAYQDTMQVSEFDKHKSRRSNLNNGTDLDYETNDQLRPSAKQAISKKRIRNKRAAMNGHSSDPSDSLYFKSMRREDDQDEEQGDEISEDQDSFESDPSVQQGNNREAYQYVAASDPSLQELLAHKQLLDSLRLSKLSNGTIDGFSGSQSSSGINQTPSNSPTSSDQHVRAAAGSQGLVEHKPVAADNHYTIDEGLLLRPALKEESDHQSMSAKRVKKKEKKAKKKLTMAVKKGGHKEKKHDKEEKKYLKEKKFKGAKKGKKMSKGKGGKGSKKGSKFYKDKGFKKKGFKNIYVKNEFGQKKSYFDEFRDKDFKKKWKNFDDKYNYAQMKKWQAKDVKGAKKMKDQGKNFKKYHKGKWKKKYNKNQESESSKKKKKFENY